MVWHGLGCTSVAASGTLDHCVDEGVVLVDTEAVRACRELPEGSPGGQHLAENLFLQLAANMQLSYHHWTNKTPQNAFFVQHVSLLQALHAPCARLHQVLYER